MKLNLVRLAAIAALTVSTSAAFAGPGIPMPDPTTGFVASSFGPGIPMPDPTTGFVASSFGPGIPMPDPTTGFVANRAV